MEANLGNIERPVSKKTKKERERAISVNSQIESRVGKGCQIRFRILRLPEFGLLFS